MKIIDTRNYENALNSDLESISCWAAYGNCNLILILRDIFDYKLNTNMYPPVTFNSNTISKFPHHKHLGVVLDFKLDIYIAQKIKKCYKM